MPMYIALAQFTEKGIQGRQADEPLTGRIRRFEVGRAFLPCKRAIGTLRNSAQRRDYISLKVRPHLRVSFVPIPFTFLRSSALLNGRAAMIRAAIIGPTPGTVLNSFSVAVLMSILPISVFSLVGGALASSGLLAMDEPRLGTEEIGADAFARGVARG